jgi:hypothetical protein
VETDRYFEMKPLFLIISEMAGAISGSVRTALGFKSKTKTRAIANDRTRGAGHSATEAPPECCLPDERAGHASTGGFGERLTMIRHHYVAAALLTVRLPKCPSGSGYEQPSQCIIKERPASGATKLDVTPPPLHYAVRGFAPLRRLE